MFKFDMCDVNSKYHLDCKLQTSIQNSRYLYFEASFILQLESAAIFFLINGQSRKDPRHQKKRENK